MRGGCGIALRIGGAFNPGSYPFKDIRVRGCVGIPLFDLLERDWSARYIYMHCQRETRDRRSPSPTPLDDPVSGYLPPPV